MTHSEPPRPNPERVLVLTRTQRDADLTRQLLSRADFDAHCCSETAELAYAIREGAGAALIAEEALLAFGTAELERAIFDQPAWSDFPLIVFGQTRQPPNAPDPLSEALKGLGNVTLLDRPVHVRTMLAAVQAALRSRRRQYAARDEIESRDQFLAMLGHELRNPLGALLVATEIMERDPNPGTQRSQRAVLARHVTHLARLVDDLLDVARVAAGKIKLERTAIEFNELVSTAIESTRTTGRLQGLEISAELLRESVWVDGDRVRLAQVLDNLLTNAIKYTPLGGEIGVSVETRDDEVVVRVTDTGIGIESDMLARVFDLFAQADRSLERARGGMGIGLTLVQNLVRLHGGRVRAESAGLGRGSTFVVILPRGERPATEEPSKRPKSSDRQRAAWKLVVVEDNVDLREGLEELLELNGYRVESASDGIDGARLIIETKPNAALVDIGLPGIDGYEVARQVRAALGSSVRLVALTGYGQPEDRKCALKAGFDAHLTKPVHSADVELALHPVAAASGAE